MKEYNSRKKLQETEDGANQSLQAYTTIDEQDHDLQSTEGYSPDKELQRRKEMHELKYSKKQPDTLQRQDSRSSQGSKKGGSS